MGGWIGFELGAAAPDRLLSLIIGGSAAFAGNPRPADGDVWLDGLRWGMETLVLQWEESVDDFWITPREREQWLASDADALTAARRQRLIEPDLSEQAVSAIRLPALIYAGTNDAPEEVERSARLMPDATFLPLEGLNHAQAFTRSDLLVPTVLEFLEQIEETKSLRS